MRAVQALRDGFWQALRQRFGERVVLNGHPEARLPNTLNVSFVGHVGSEILARLEGIAASTGSACHAGRIELSGAGSRRRRDPIQSRPRHEP
jgi:cysteine desulfurase